MEKRLSIGGLVLKGNKAGISEPRKYKSGDDIDYINGGVIEGLADAYGPSIDNKIMEGAKILSDVLQKVFTPLQNKGTSNTTGNTSDDMIKMKIIKENSQFKGRKLSNGGYKLGLQEQDTAVHKQDEASVNRLSRSRAKRKQDSLVNSSIKK